MLQCGLLGRRLGHSFSPEIHALLADYPYELIELEPEALGEFLQSTPYDGLNVTIPYKKDVLAYCASLSPAAEAIGCVNTLVRRENGWHGDNTDYAGFAYMLDSLNVDIKGKKALVFGTGGASLTVNKVLSDRGAGEIVHISRFGENNYNNLSLHADAKVIINATPLGMYPNAGAAPASLENFPLCEAVLDVVYNPSRTALLLDAEKRGIPHVGGLGMLVAQAHAAAEIFLNKSLDRSIICRIQKEIEKKTRNIILVGMPGSGKSKKGQLLAGKLGREFVDADEYFTSCHGLSPAEAIKSLGEEKMREMETHVLKILGQRSGLVIATGGGCVTREENYPLLHQNGIIIWVKRPLEELPTKGRPLSQSCGVAELYNRRAGLYEAFADVEIEVSSSVEEAVDAIMEAIK
ncbi:MAG: shikimate kinase [Oscillospiraceae bacterium]|nr:shikimate kinase [Oscillospiraceae bacterium]